MSANQYQTFSAAIKALFEQRGIIPRAAVVTYGCQQNISDSEIIKGLITECGYVLTDEPEKADLVVFNTCAVREHAELRVYGNIGALKPVKRKRPDLKIAVCGCMMQQEKVQREIKEKFKHIDMVFGPSLIYKLPEMLWNSLSSGEKTFELTEHPEIIEGLPVHRADNNKAWVTVMYGCNNFCTYCIVPYVRGRERSRRPEDVINEVRELVKAGYKDITLLGQNVNSYGKDLDTDTDFADILSEINGIEGDFWIRFVTSHPKDCTEKLLDTMSRCDKVCKQLHLPFQSGNNRVLKAMNRRYTREQYLELVRYARSKMPDIVLTSDVIVGFPGETDEEFEDTVSLVREVEFDNLFTFIYSKRSGTPAAEMDDPITDEQKSRRFNELLSALHPISRKKNELLHGKTVRVFVEGESKTDSSVLTGKTEGGKTVDFVGPRSLIGGFAEVYIKECKTWNLLGELRETND